jgi:hypothetical protein
VDGSKKLVSSKFLVPSSWSFDYLHTYEFINSLALLSVFGFGLWALGFRLEACSLQLEAFLYALLYRHSNTGNHQPTSAGMEKLYVATVSLQSGIEIPGAYYAYSAFRNEG